ncbi:PDR/VanB family oxidoreductase [Hoeflea ulvae]|uniref:PDR/VanB family oxidoreductase n=1 Tax=Hoeflea ulvae TaxID=2983764 RepID=A0ABT3YLZ5_9HYPH|nr:PDR/VanB family oxidoreductase [Hoeflea ulvae]MCY0096913.1 PDR/VanB family oxidoreductase [Hoeflea ulvae]
MSDRNDTIRMAVAARRSLTPSIMEFVLTPAEVTTLPGYGPGAHVTVQTPSGAMRRYSLTGAGDDPKQYVIAVKREPASRGGSQSMHDDATEGTELLVQPPENDFSLKKAPKYLLIAGGIGITPIFAMARQLESTGDDFSIIYCTRNAEETAYLDELTEAYGARVLLHHDDGDPERIYDFWDHFAEPQNMHVYCCGPKPLMEEIKAISGHWPEGRVNFEDFKPVEVIRPDDTAFDVELARSGKTVTVQGDRSILEAVREAGVKTVSSCESGTCGTCKTRLISGDVDHRDMVLMDEERQDRIMICVSRARSGGLVIDL